MAGITTTILDCLKVNGVPIVTWINSLISNLQAQIDALETDLTNLHTDVTNIKNQLAALQALVTALQTCCANMQQYIALSHKPLAITHNQDVANRVTLDLGNQVLNLPPPIMAQIQSSSVTQPLQQAVPDGGILTTLNNVLPDFETVPGMNSPGKIIIPKTGRYRVIGSWSCNTDETDAAQGYSIGLTIALNQTTAATGFGRYTAPLINLRAEQVLAVIPAWPLTQGDQLSLLAYTDYPGGVTAYGAYLYAEYLEGS